MDEVEVELSAPLVPLVAVVVEALQIHARPMLMDGGVVIKIGRRECREGILTMNFKCYHEVV